MNWLRTLWQIWKRERNRRRRWRERTCYTWRDPRNAQREFEGWQRRMKQS